MNFKSEEKIISKNNFNLIKNILILIVLIPLAYFLITLTSGGFKKPAESTLDTAVPTKIAFVGDQGLTDDSKKVLQLIKNEGVDLVVFLGDFDYTDRPNFWVAQNKKYLGDTEYVAIMGNHDEKTWTLYKKIITDQYNQNKKVLCTGDVGEQESCVINNIKIVGTAPGITSADHAGFIQKEFSINPKSPNDSVNWNICIWHKNQTAMQTGDKTDEAGWQVYEACKDAGAMIVTGHEHAYSRTHLLSNIMKQVVIDTDNDYEIKPGQSIVVVSGLGGHSIREQKLFNPWWAKVYSQTQGAVSGALFCDYNTLPKQAKCYFKNINNEIIDTFTLHSI